VLALLLVLNCSDITPRAMEERQLLLGCFGF
jgi:hypothetical protein